MSRVYSITEDNVLRLIEAESQQIESAFDGGEEFRQLVRNWPLRRLVEVWNRLPGVRPVTRLENREITAGLNGNFLNGCSNRDLFGSRLFSSQPSVKASTADFGERAQPFNTESALQRGLHFGNLVVDSGPPLSPGVRRRASTLARHF